MKNKVKISQDQQRAVAHLSAKEANREKRTVPVLLSTGQRGVRYDFWEDTRYFEELSLEPGHVRIRPTLPLLDNHRVSTDTHLGIVRNVTLYNGELRGEAHFDKHPLALQRFESVADGFIEDNSIGYRVYKYERVGEAQDPFDPLKNIPILRAVDWEPKESSLVPIGFDTEAKFKREDEAVQRTVEIQIETRQNSEVKKMPDDQNVETPQVTAENVIREVAAATVTPAPAAPVDLDSIRAEVAKAERDRVSEILRVCTATNRSDLASDFISRGVTIDEVNREILREIEKTNFRAESPIVSAHISVGKSDIEKRNEGMVNAILHRVNPSVYQLNDNGRSYRGLTLLDMAREAIGSNSRDREGIIQRAFMTTSNFKHVLNTVAERTLQDQFRVAPRTFEPIVRRGLVNDFRPVGRTRLTDMSGLVKIPEHGEFKAAEITDVNGAQVRVETYGRKFSLTRQAIINDQLDAFDEIPRMVGRKAATLESKLVYSIIKSNPIMSDGYALFSAQHGNLAGTPAALSDASITAALLAYRGQVTEDDEEFIDVAPKFLVIPPALEATALRLMSTINPTTTDDINLYSGRFRIISEPRLSAAAGGSDTAWYLFPYKDDIDTIDLVNLRGFEGIQVEEIEAENILGVTWRAFYDVGAAPIEWRGVYKNAGA